MKWTGCIPWRDSNPIATVWGRRYPTGKSLDPFQESCTAAGLAQSVERLTAEWEVAGSIPGSGPILGVLK